MGGKELTEPLELVKAFVNTYDVEEHTETFRTPAETKAWLVERDLMAVADRAAAADVAYAIETREAVRSMLLANGGVSLDAEAVETVNRAAGRAQLTLTFDLDGGSSLRPRAPGVDGAIGTIIAVAFAAMADGSWTRLKVCPEETCQWAFFDRSKNRSKRWCSMEVCGNRTKVRTYRKRHHDVDA